MSLLSNNHWERFHVNTGSFLFIIFFSLKVFPRGKYDWKYTVGIFPPDLEYSILQILHNYKTCILYLRHFLFSVFYNTTL